mmetsp:Transcript_106144/g.210897  ORF Transcript_106144/g.210897 Transcript_106144/m.210897 type:complete len:222 (-) Transcript_106144:7-672(-)
MKPGTMRWNGQPRKCRPRLFWPVQSCRKFSTVRGTTSANSSKSMRPLLSTAPGSVTPFACNGPSCSSRNTRGREPNEKRRCLAPPLLELLLDDELLDDDEDLAARASRLASRSASRCASRSARFFSSSTRNSYSFANRCLSRSSACNRCSGVNLLLALPSPFVLPLSVVVAVGRVTFKPRGLFPTNIQREAHETGGQEPYAFIAACQNLYKQSHGSLEPKA